MLTCIPKVVVNAQPRRKYITQTSICFELFVVCSSRQPLSSVYKKRPLLLFVTLFVAFHTASLNPTEIIRSVTMVNFTPHFLALLAFGHAVTAAQTVTSFSEWVEGIIADPNGDHLSPEDAVAAFKSGVFSVPSAGT